MMEKTKELTLKQRLQNLSEAPIPFFHSLTPFAAGFTQGFNYEKKRLVSALVNNSEVTKDFINEPISVPLNYPQVKDLWDSDFIEECLRASLTPSPLV